MAVNNLVKSLQNIMRSDAGVNGDAQRIEQMVWMFFLKVYDAQELDWECEDEDYQSIIPEQYRWRNWAPSRDENGQKVATALTGDELLRMVNDMFDALKNLPVTEHTKRGQSIVRDVFSEVNQYMKNGVLLRQMIDKVDEIDFTDSQDIHAFGDIYESLLKDLQGAGHAGEFYTPRALTDLIIEMLDPRIGETVGDFAMGTGGFLTSALHHLQPQQKDDDDVERFQHSVIGQEWKPFPYLLAVTNLFLHGIKEPNVLHGDSLARNVRELKESDKVDVIAMNPPYGGATEASVKGNFPQDMRSSETADLFLVLIMYRLRERGRAGVIVPDGFLFGTDGAKLAIKQKMLRDFNLHTIIRLPGSIFSPYTSIATNILFFNNEQAEGASEGYKTNCTWFYRLDMPEGYKHFSKTRPMLSQHCQPIRDWWHDRHEIVSEDGDEKSRCFTAQQLIDLSCNFDQCKFPKEEEEILPPDELLRQYHERRNSLDAEIDRTLTKIQNMLGIEL